MSTISGVSGGRTGWQDVSNSTRGTDRKDRMFAKADSNGDGSVDGAELQSVLDKMAQKSGGTAANADTVLKSMDSDGSGGLNADELDAGMKSLMPAPASTMAFAQRRGDEGPRGLDGPPPPPPDAADGTAAAGSTGSSEVVDGLQSLLANLFQAADTDGNGSLDKTELDTLKTNFDSAVQSLVNGSDSSTATSGSTSTSDTGTTSTSSSSTVASSSSSDDSTGSTSTSNPDSMMSQLTALADLVLKEYAATAASSSTSSQAASLNVTA